MNSAAISGLFLAGVLVAFGTVTTWLQLRGLARLRTVKILPSDERNYYHRRYVRRTFTGATIAIIGAMIGGSYLSGMEGRADALGDGGKAQVEGEKPAMAEQDKAFVRFWGGFWIVVVVLVFVVMTLALVDVLATRRYAMQQFHTIKEDHEVKLRRDLAVYAQQKHASRGGRLGNRLGGEES